LPIELQRLEAQFKAQEADILRVIQSRTGLLQNQRADLDALDELLQSAVPVTAATGTPLESLAVHSDSELPACRKRTDENVSAE
jgi:outer membrane protein TolC